MTAAMWLRNLGAFTVQAGLLIAAGSVLARVFRLESPRAALLYWRVDPRRVSAAAVRSAVAHRSRAGGSGGRRARDGDGFERDTGTSRARRAGMAIDRASRGHRARRGLLIRSIWLAMGAWMLGRIRREASKLDPVPEP